MAKPKTENEPEVAAAEKPGTFRVRGTVPAKADGGADMILFERDPRHPGGEAFIAGTDEADVYPTAKVTALIREGKLEEV